MTSTGRYIQYGHEWGRVYSPPIRRPHAPTFADRVGAALLILAICLSGVLAIVLVGALLAVGFQVTMVVLELLREVVPLHA